MSKRNYYDRAQVIYTVGEQMRRGEIKCALCNGPLKVHGSYSRKVIDEEGKRQNGWITQGCCAVCKKYPALLPDFIMPYKHYETAVVERSIWRAYEEKEQGLSECPADESTIRRWLSQFHERGTAAAGLLRAILFRVRDRHISILDILNMSLMKQLAYLARAISANEICSVIGRVNGILTGYNSGFL